MHLRATTLDDLLDLAYRALLKARIHLTATKGPNVEINGVVLELTRPRARLSRTDTKGHVFSCFGEFIWYLSTSDQLEPIQYYLKKYASWAEADGTIWGAYGPRIFGGEERSQYEIVKDTLSKKPSSRQAVIQLFDRTDIEEPHKDVPCTCTLQFLVRDGMLNMVVHMRSNDAFLGLPHDVFAFTMMQEILARDLGQGLGTYKHMVGSFHLYDRDREKVQCYLGEGYQPTTAMPEMPPGAQWTDIREVFKAEALLRKQGHSGVSEALAIADAMSPYWADVVRLFAILALTRNFQGGRDMLRQAVDVRRSMSTQFYTGYIRKRAKALDRKVAQMELMDAPDGGGRQ